MEKLWWLYGGVMVFFCMYPTWAGLDVPWDQLTDAIRQHGLMEHLVCENTECVMTWRAVSMDGFDNNYCVFKLRAKKVLCRYSYDSYSY